MSSDQPTREAAPALQQAASFVIEGRHSAVTELKYLADHDAYFQALKAGILGWVRGLPGGGGHQISVFTNLRAAAEEQRGFAQGICRRWNEDPELSRLDTLGIEISVGTNALVSFGCTTFSDVVTKAGHVPLHVVDFGEVMQRIHAQHEQDEAQERQRRRENPVRNPAWVPLWIRWDLASYLRLEYGESFWDSDSVKPWHLEYLGEFVIDGVPTRYWRYPTSDGKPHYATVERYDDHIGLGMTADPPP